MSNRKKPRNKWLHRRQQALKQISNGQPEPLLVSAPDTGEKEVLKVVPATDGDIVVGEAIIYDDGSVDIKINDDAPEESVKKIRALEEEMNFMGMGEESDEAPGQE